MIRLRIPCWYSICLRYSHKGKQQFVNSIETNQITHPHWWSLINVYAVYMKKVSLCEQHRTWLGSESECWSLISLHNSHVKKITFLGNWPDNITSAEAPKWKKTTSCVHGRIWSDTASQCWSLISLHCSLESKNWSYNASQC